MKTTLLLSLLAAATFALPSTLQAQPKVIAHRGYWDTPGAAKNSIAALQQAARIGSYGSEFDVNVTADGVAIVTHDPTLAGRSIEQTPYADFAQESIANGEKIPTLEAYLREGMKHPQLKLVLEIKSASTPEVETRATQLILDQVKAMGAEAQVEYIAFSLHVVKEIIKHDAQAKVSYLSGNLSPAELKTIGAYGLDYHIQVMYQNPDWFEQARALGLHTNVWTVDKKEDMAFAIENGVDYITTDRPEALQAVIAGKE